MLYSLSSPGFNRGNLSSTYIEQKLSYTDLPINYIIYKKVNQRKVYPLVLTCNISTRSLRCHCPVILLTFCKCPLLREKLFSR